MVGWHHRINGHEFEQALGDSEEQGSLACCSPWGCRESDTTELLNKNKNVAQKAEGGEYKKRVRNVLVRRDKYRRQEKEIQCAQTTNKNWRSKQGKDQKKENLLAA